MYDFDQAMITVFLFCLQQTSPSIPNIVQFINYSGHSKPEYAEMRSDAANLGNTRINVALEILHDKRAAVGAML